jgi:hypothetical protein
MSEFAAHAVASLVSPPAASTTGAVLRVDGGMTSLRIGWTPIGAPIAVRVQPRAVTARMVDRRPTRARR